MGQLGVRLREMRKQAGLSQEELSRRLAQMNTSARQTHISAIECGHNTPSLALLINMARVLETDPNALLGWDADATASKTRAAGSPSGAITARRSRSLRRPSSPGWRAEG